MDELARIPEFEAMQAGANEAMGLHDVPVFGDAEQAGKGTTSVFNAAFMALIENTERQDAFIKQLRDKVEFQPDAVIEEAKLYITYCDGWLETPDAAAMVGGVEDMRKFKTELEGMQRMAADVKQGKRNTTQRTPIDLTEVQLRSGTPSLQKSGDSDETPEVR